jgi:hypothetical protein
MTTMTRRWLARASFALMLAAAALLLAVAGWRSLTLVAFAVIGVCAVLAGGYWFLAHRGLLRWLALVLVIAAPVLIVVAFAWHHLLWAAVVAVALMVDALTDGEELRVDLGVIADRTFVNNASFGAYAEVVRSPAYRDDKRGTTLQMPPELLNGRQVARLSAPGRFRPD